MARKRTAFVVVVLMLMVGLAACHIDEGPWGDIHAKAGHKSELSAMHVVNGPEDSIPGCSTNWNGSPGAFNGYLQVNGSCDMTRQWIKGGLYHVNGGTLTLNDSIVAGGAIWLILHMAHGGTLNLNDTTVQWRGDGTNPAPSGAAAVGQNGGGNWTIRRSHISGNADGIQAAGTVLVEDSWINNLAQGPGTHNDGIQLFHGSLLIRRSVIEIGDHCDPSNTGCVNGAVFTQEGGGNVITTVRAEDSYLDGGGYIWRPEDCTSSELHNTLLGPNYLFAQELPRSSNDCPATVYS
jgi:hypothetical protein